MTSCAVIALTGLEADEARCREHVENSTAAATALLPALGYERAGEAARLAKETGRSIRETVDRTRLAHRPRIRCFDQPGSGLSVGLRRKGMAMTNHA